MAVLLYGVGSRGQAKPGKGVLPVINAEYGLKVSNGYQRIKGLFQIRILRIWKTIAHLYNRKLRQKYGFDENILSRFILKILRIVCP
jgi:hypothetical protein